jgi:uncharacterized membrane protein YeaQ/YmgE (transglycosylase-associated protein family)
MTDNLDSARNRIGTIATIVVCIIAFGVLMGIRGEFEQHWVQTVIAGCAGAFLGVALYQTKKCWPRHK